MSSNKRHLNSNERSRGVGRIKGGGIWRGSKKEKTVSLPPPPPPSFPASYFYLNTYTKVFSPSLIGDKNQDGRYGLVFAHPNNILSD